MSPLSLCFGVLLLVVGGFARSDEHDSGERSYHVPDLAHEGVKHDFSSSVEEIPDDTHKPRMKRSYDSWGSDDDILLEDSDEVQTIPKESHFSVELPRFVWEDLPKFFTLGDEDVSSEEITPTTESPVVNFFNHFADAHLSNDVNEVTFESHEDKQVLDEVIVVTPSSIEVHEEVINIYEPQVGQQEVTSSPAISSDEILSIYQSLRPIFFEPQVPHDEPSEVVIMVNDVKIQVTRNQKQPTYPLPYYYMANRG